MSSLTFKECYELLRINHDVSWIQARKAYKTLIQKSHPDRFADNSFEKTNAEENIKKIIAAYKKLETHYKTYNKLPDTSIDNDQPITPTRKRKKSWENEQNSYKTRNKFDITKSTGKTDSRSFKQAPAHDLPSKSKFRILAVLLPASALSVAVFYFINSLVPEKPDSLYQIRTPASSKLNTNAPLPEPSPKSKHKDTIKRPFPSKEFFTIGSSIGKVILVQGEPSNINGNIWHYGKSLVYFKKGLVTEWKRHPDHPLKVLLTGTKSPLTKKPKDTTNKKNNKRFYPWQKE